MNTEVNDIFRLTLYMAAGREGKRMRLHPEVQLINIRIGVDNKNTSFRARQLKINPTHPCEREKRVDDKGRMSKHESK